jgi:hypothetical protein
MTSHPGLARHARPSQRQRGSAMIEFAVVGPLLVLLGTTILQYALMFNAKNMVNHAGFMAARAGSLAHADPGAVREAYARALVPLYGGGRNGRELAEALVRAQTDTAAHSRIELLNPIRESFDDWADESLAQRYGGHRAIRNSNLSYRDASQVGARSGQNIQDANLIKLRITHGYELSVPLASTVMQFMMRWNDTRRDPFVTALHAQRRIPLVSHVTLQMQSDPVEPGNPLSLPGQGNNGTPSDPGTPATPPITPPNCVTVGCTVIVDPTPPPGGGSSGGGGATGNPPLHGCPPGDPNCTPLCPTG